MAGPERALATTPDRPATPLDAPGEVLALHVDVHAAQLANPVVAVGRLLASEAEAFARVSGDERELLIEIALVDSQVTTREAAAAWARWALHNAGVRGVVTALDDPAAEPTSVCGPVPEPVP